jgi:hypothetical protein
MNVWEHVGDALRQQRPPADAVAAMLRRAAREPEPVPPRTGLARHASFALQLVLAQTRLIRMSVWLASVLVMGLGVVLAALRAGHVVPASVLSIVAPLVAAAGIAGVCGPDRDPGLELMTSTMTSPRVVLVARVTLVFGYDLVLALVASVVLAGVGVDPGGLGELINAWLGPMALLSAVCLLMGVAVGTAAAVTVTLALCLTRALAPALATGTQWLDPVARGITWLWTTSLPTALLTAAMLGAAVAIAGRIGEPRTRPGATNPA